MRSPLHAPGSPPLISIVTSSYNQAQFIGRTIESVRSQDYPAVEHIVVDGMSSDGTAAVLSRYPHLKVIREPDRGQADAINKGFRIATGRILGFLNSDDTLEPGALSRVAAAVDPAAGRHVVMGRCRFIDEEDRFLGVEHPSGFESHRRILQIWKGHLLPQPAIFWTREVWDACGPLSVDEQLMLDYDLFCRMSRRHRFCRVDHVLANYRLHVASKTTSVTDAERLEQAILVSRRYWGSPLRGQYWRMLLSYAAFRFNRRVRAVRLMQSGRQLWRTGSRAPALGRLALGTAMAPDVVCDVLVLPALTAAEPRLTGAWRRVAGRRRRAVLPQTQAWFGLTRTYDDGWAGPTLAIPIDMRGTSATLTVRGTIVPAHLRRPLSIEAFLDGRSLGSRRAGRLAEFSATWDLAAAAPGPHELRLVANTFMVPDDYLGNGDFRPLSYRPGGAWLESGAIVTQVL